MGAEVRTLATGLRFPEGPVRLGEDDVVVVEIQAGRVTRCAGGTTSTVATTGGGPNGLALANDGSLVVANNGGVSVGPGGYWFADEPIGGRIQRIDAAGTVMGLLADIPTVTPRPNDLCFGSDGRLYFTDPANWDDLANLLPGRLWRADADGSNLTLLTEGGRFPNGIAFSPDGSILYVAYSLTQDVLAYPWSPAGLGEPRRHCVLSSGFPDGMAVASDGSLIVCGSMGDVIHVFDADGTLRSTLDTPAGSEPTNCCLDDGRLYVTMSGSGELVALPIDLEPAPLFG